MKPQVGLLALASNVTALSVARQGPGDEAHVIGGQDARIEDFPWMASLIYGSGPLCGASVLGERYILTAAHCVDLIELPSELTIGVGSARVDRGTEYKAKTFHIHPKWNTSSIDYDVAVIEVANRIRLGPNVRAVDLADSIPADGYEVQLAGWGIVRNGGPATRDLQSATIKTINHQRCKENYVPLEAEVTDRMLCAGLERGGRGACNGDSGGPLTRDGEQFGIVSWGGQPCADRGKPGVYASIPNPEIRDFIRSKARV